MYFSKEMQETSLKLTKKWANEVKKSLKDNPDQKERFSTVSDTEIKRLYTPEDIKNTDFAHICERTRIGPFKCNKPKMRIINTTIAV